jgi:hypothetical protein
MSVTWSTRAYLPAVSGMPREVHAMHAMSVEIWEHGDRRYECTSTYSVADDCRMHELTETTPRPVNNRPCSS